MTKTVRRVLASLAVLLVVGLLFRVAYQTCLCVAYPRKYEELVTASAAACDLPPSLVYAVIHTESHFDPQAVSAAGAKGLMQLMDSTFEWVQTRIPGEDESVQRVFDPEVNIRSGCEVLKFVLAQFEHTETALAAYNAGSGNVSAWLKNTAYSDDGITLKVVPVEETRRYITRVLKAQKMYQTIYGEA